MIVLDLSILNQKGTPMFYSDVLSARPTFGIVGRIFIATDSPYGIFRDTGTSWVQIASVGTSNAITGSGTATQVAYFTSSSAIGSSSNLFWDNTNGRIGINTSTPGSSVDAHGTGGTIIQSNSTTLGNSLMSFQLQGTGKWQIGNVYNAGANYFRVYDQLNSIERIVQNNTGELDILGWEVLTNNQTGLAGNTTTGFNNSFNNNFTYNSGISTIASFNSIGLLVDNNLNWSGANTISSTSYNATGVLRTNMTFGSASASITYTQATGIRALTNKQSIYIQNGANSGTISHYANLQIFGDQKLGAGTTTFTNRYQILLNDYAEFSAGNTYTNRWAIYQSGASNTNYFNGKIITGSSTTISTYQLDVTGTARVSGDASVNGMTIGKGLAQTATNSAIGFETLNASTTGIFNTAVGYRALKANTTGDENTAIGYLSLQANTTGINNVAIGSQTLQSNINGRGNVGIGELALQANTSGTHNIGIGERGLYLNTSGGSNVALGNNALQANTTGSTNVALGVIALYTNTTGNNNMAIGVESLYTNNGSNNVGIGVESLQANTTGGNNVGIGYRAGRYITANAANAITNNSIYIGFQTKALANNQTNQIVIGYDETGLGSNTTIIGNSSTTLTALRGSLILGTTSSNASSILQADSTTKGFLLPRMTTTQKNAIGTPAQGLMVFDTTLVKLCVYNGTTWETITSV